MKTLSNRQIKIEDNKRSAQQEQDMKRHHFDKFNEFTLEELTAKRESLFKYRNETINLRKKDPVLKDSHVEPEHKVDVLNSYKDVLRQIKADLEMIETVIVSKSN